MKKIKSKLVVSFCARCCKNYKAELICKVFGMPVTRPHDCAEQKEWDEAYIKRRSAIKNI